MEIGLKPVKEIPKKEIKGRRSAYEELVQKFLQSGQPQMEVVWDGDKPKPQTVYQQLLKICKKVDGVKVVMRNGRIFLVKVEK